jgi:hypothetical protein
MAQYIDKDAVLAIIEQLKDEAIDMEDKARWFLSAALTKRIEALEVKEVDEEPYVMGKTGKFTTTTK